jgi:hypothetical protein
MTKRGAALLVLVIGIAAADESESVREEAPEIEPLQPTIRS